MSDQPSRPRASRPHFPEGYGTPPGDEGLLPWSHVEQRMRAAKNYWVCTARLDGQPHATPVWGVWVDGKLYCDGSPQTRRGRDIAANPKAAVHLEDGDQAVILEGEAHILSAAPPPELALRISQAYCAKYAPFGYTPAPDSWDAGGLFVFTPRLAFAWTRFPDDTTRWMLDSG